MPVLFLYGQTIQPIELVMTGAYKIILFQLYPFVLKSFFNVVPKDLNDNCYDLEQLNATLGMDSINQLQRTRNFNEKAKIISSFLNSLFKQTGRT
jgi:hypothetical protein